MKVEWCQRPHLRRGLMVSEAALMVFMDSKDAGYRSVYMFSDEDAEKIEEARHSRGLDQYDVYSDCVFIDIDSGVPDLDACLHELRSRGLAHSVFHSGSKGYHVVIPLKEIVCGKNVPYSQRKWVEGLGCKHDPSIYRAGALISLPGRKHPKTGIQKKLIRREPGEALELPLLEAPAPKVMALENVGIALGLTQLQLLIANPPGEGERYMSLWKTAKSLAEAGLQEDTTLDLLTVVNDNWPNPKEYAEVVRAVRGAYV